MTKNDAEKICVERLKRWKGKLVNEVATPVLLLGVSHGNELGKLVLCITEDLGEDDLKIFVRYLYVNICGDDYVTT